MKKYDKLSTVVYAVGRAAETESDPKVKEQLEDLKIKMATSIQIVKDGIDIRKGMNRKTWIRGLLTGSACTWAGIVIGLIIRSL